MPSNQPQPPGSPNPFSSGVLFAKRKKNIFKGPTLNFGGGLGMAGGRSGSAHSRSGSGSARGRPSGEITIQEEEEDENAVAEDPDEDIEEVDMFNPIVGGPGETIEEQIIEDEDEEPTTTININSPTFKHGEEAATAAAAQEPKPVA